MEAIAEFDTDILSDYELERGKPMPSLQHALTQENLVFSIKSRYRHLYRVLPEITLEMPEKPDCVPDVAIYAASAIQFEPDAIRMTAMPLTTIEIMSPSQTDDELVAKTDRYFRAGVKSCWVVLPSFRAILVYSQPRKYHFFVEDSTLTDPATGIELAVNEIFQ
jgi:Uma2 family endonuclease